MDALEGLLKYEAESRQSIGFLDRWLRKNPHEIVSASVVRDAYEKMHPDATAERLADLETVVGETLERRYGVGGTSRHRVR
jgi:hypothetical protein